LLFPSRTELALEDLATFYTFAIKLDLDGRLIDTRTIALLLGSLSRIRGLEHNLALASVHTI
jgi:hypothetical protein